MPSNGSAMEVKRQYERKQKEIVQRPSFLTYPNGSESPRGPDYFATQDTVVEQQPTRSGPTRVRIRSNTLSSSTPCLVIRPCPRRCSSTPVGSCSSGWSSLFLQEIDLQQRRTERYSLVQQLYDSRKDQIVELFQNQWILVSEELDDLEGCSIASR